MKVHLKHGKVTQNMNGASINYGYIWPVSAPHVRCFPRVFYAWPCMLRQVGTALGSPYDCVVTGITYANPGSRHRLPTTTPSSNRLKTRRKLTLSPVTLLSNSSLGSGYLINRKARSSSSSLRIGTSSH